MGWLPFVAPLDFRLAVLRAFDAWGKRGADGSSELATGPSCPATAFER
jgi:hypothetical protein